MALVLISILFAVHLCSWLFRFYQSGLHCDWCLVQVCFRAWHALSMCHDHQTFPTSNGSDLSFLKEHDLMAHCKNHKSLWTLSIWLIVICVFCQYHNEDIDKVVRKWEHFFNNHSLKAIYVQKVILMCERSKLFHSLITQDGMCTVPMWM